MVCQRPGNIKGLAEYYENATTADHQNGICKERPAKVRNN